MNLGDAKVSNKSTNQLEMNKWYHVQLTRKGTTAQLLINQKDKTIIQSPKTFSVLDISDKLYFGGVEKLTTK